MVIEILSKTGQGGYQCALDFMEASAQVSRPSQTSSCLTGLRPWCVIAPSGQTSLYLPGLPVSFRKSAAEGRLRWVHTTEALAPVVCQLILESGLCEGVFLQGLDHFENSSPAGIWGRRWQIAARQGASHLVWLHSTPLATLGVDLKIEWSAPHRYEIKKGHRYFDQIAQRIIIDPSQNDFGHEYQGDFKIEKSKKAVHASIREYAKSESSAA